MSEYKIKLILTSNVQKIELNTWPYLSPPQNSNCELCQRRPLHFGLIHCNHIVKTRFSCGIQSTSVKSSFRQFDQNIFSFWKPLP